MFDRQKPPLHPVSPDAATDPATGDPVGEVDAVLARWTTQDPCAAAVAELATIDPNTLEDADRVRLVIALERQAGWITSLQLPALVAVGDAHTEVVADARDRATERLAAAQDADPAAAAEDRDGRTVAQTVSSIFGEEPDRWATMELATALHVAEFTAAQRLHVARVLPVRLPHLAYALRRGLISYGHVLLVVRATEPLTDELAREVDAKLAARYGKATPGGLRNTARNAVIAADPAGAQARHEEAARRRQVSSRPENDGMATLCLYSTAPDISLLEAAICDIADATAKAAHDAGRVIPDQDALHADALIALARYWLHDTWPIPEPDPRDPPDNDHRPTESDTPDGPVDAPQRPPMQSPRPHACNGAPGSRTPSSRTPSSRTPSTDLVADLDHLPGKHLPDTTWQHSRTDLDGDEPDAPEQTGRAPADRSPADLSPADRSPADPVPDARGPDEPEPEPDEDPDGGGDGRPPDAGGTDTEPPARWGKRGLRRRGRDRTVVNIVIDLPTLLGLADNPARLDGHGDIPAGLARRIAADATWRRMITDPITRRLLDRSPNTYRPGRALADYVRARDLICDHPGCTKPADGCQLDHDNPYNLADPDGGRTTADELKLRCDPHHNGKTHLGWATGLRADGTRFTRSPLGFDYDLELNPYLEPNPYVDHGQKPPTRLSIVTPD